jgi:uncharacterized protein YecE (DUF72 family)
VAEAEKLGVLHFQYPVSFHYSPENIEAIEKVLRSFYDYNKVVELRHKSWGEKDAEVKRLLDDYRASEVLIDEPKFGTSIRQQRVPGEGMITKFSELVQGKVKSYRSPFSALGAALLRETGFV